MLNKGPNFFSSCPSRTPGGFALPRGHRFLDLDYYELAVLLSTPSWTILSPPGRFSLPPGRFSRRHRLHPEALRAREIFMFTATRREPVPFFNKPLSRGTGWRSRRRGGGAFAVGTGRTCPLGHHGRIGAGGRTKGIESGACGPRISRANRRPAQYYRRQRALRSSRGRRRVFCKALQTKDLRVGGAPPERPRPVFPIFSVLQREPAGRTSTHSGIRASRPRRRQVFLDAAGLGRETSS